jgi:hypothetical protein
MITRSQVEEVVNQAESGFSHCWEILASVKKGQFEADSKISLVRFQPILATAIFDLTHVYRKIEQESRALINQKLRYNQAWFHKRIRFLSKEQKKLNSAIAIGKGIGDAFALFFYQGDPHYISEHLAQPSQIHVPPGIGGAGELEFAKNVSNVWGYFVVYHGITNILRLGDITLIDLKNFRVAGIGEIKSHYLEPGLLTISLLVSGPGLELPQVLKTLTAANQGEQSESIYTNLSPSNRDRLKRQLKKITESYKKLGQSSDAKLELETSSSYEDLSKFVASLRSSRFQYSNLSNGLLICGYKERARSLYRKLSPMQHLDVSAWLEGLEAATESILAIGRNDNSLHIRPFFYETDFSTCHLPGMTHIAWWPISDDIIRKILFQDVSLFTLLNSAHLVEKLEASGWSIEDKDRPLGSVKVSKPHGKATLVAEGMSYYMSMIHQYLLSEDVVISLLAKVEKQVDSTGPTLPQRISLLPIQKFGPPSV